MHRAHRKRNLNSIEEGHNSLCPYGYNIVLYTEEDRKRRIWF